MILGSKTAWGCVMFLDAVAFSSCGAKKKSKNQAESIFEELAREGEEEAASG